ncbi:MAG: helix-hairpin-helix domain-containing protein, partial [Thermoguttaceae bacterium]|nr:helix-hairpin-helix domain-containing protein [Thermoguttaceae bacterium]
LGADDVAKIAAAYYKQRQLNDRKSAFLKTIAEQGKLTDELERRIREARTSRSLDDLYLPFKPKRRPAAQIERRAYLEPLARVILNAENESQNLEALAAPFVDAEKGVPTVEDALAGAKDVAAELFNETIEFRRKIRDKIQSFGKLVTKKVENEADVAETPGEASAADDSTSEAKSLEKSKNTRRKKQGADNSRNVEQLEREFAGFFDATFNLRMCPSHRVLTMNRGERAGIISVNLDVDVERLKAVAQETFVPAGRPFAAFVEECAAKALLELTLPSLSAEALRELNERAENQEIAVCARNLQHLLMQRPLARRRVLAFDPGARNGCQIAALDEFGNVLATGSLYPQKSSERNSAEKSAQSAAAEKVVGLAERYKLSVFAIGNGPARRETEKFVAKLIEERFAGADVGYIVVNDTGAYAYAGGALAKVELAYFDPRARGAISIGRRLQDPLNELVKIDPEWLAVGMHRRSVRVKTLKEALTSALASRVNAVGVDLNAASLSTLHYVAGLTPATATGICEYRKTNGPFRNREQLKEIPGLRETAFAYCAGFLKIVNGDNPLDATWIHPESYELATKVLAALGFVPEDVVNPVKKAAIAEAAKNADAKNLAKTFGGGEFTVAEILAEIANPGADMRETSVGPIFKKGALKIEDLQPGMELTGVVLNVVDFGVFVDIGLNESGLIHISQLGGSFVKDARQEVSIGDAVKVWIHEVDVERRRVSLTTLPPGATRERRSEGGARRPRRDDASADSRTPREDARGERRPRREKPANGERSERPNRDDRGERDDKASRGERKERGFKKGGRRPDHSTSAPMVVVAPAKGKKIVEISEEQKAGKEPLRGFDQLAQFWGRGAADDEQNAK